MCDVAEQALADIAVYHVCNVMDEFCPHRLVRYKDLWTKCMIKV